MYVLVYPSTHSYVCCFADADPGDVVFVQNATTGINAVIRSIVKTFQPGDSILLLDIVYGKCCNPT